MGSHSIIGSSSGFNNGSRKVVDDYFRDHSSYWRDVYQFETLSACIYRERQRAVLAIVDSLGLPGRSSVMEVGCGAGLTTVALAKRGLAVTAVDTVEDMLSLTRLASVKGGVDTCVKTILADVQRLSFPSQFFDLVIAVGVLSWLGRAENALAELFRVIRPRGHVILTVGNNWCLNQILDPLCFPGFRPMRWRIATVLENFKVRSPSRPRLHRHSIGYFDRLLRQAGLRKLGWQTLGFGPFTSFRKRLLPDSAGIKVHRALQGLADRQFPGIRSLGVAYVVLAQRP